MGNFYQRETISDRISHFLVKSIQKQLDKVNKNKSEDVQLENKNEPEFQYPTNLTPFYLHWKCSISENAKPNTRKSPVSVSTLVLIQSLIQLHSCSWRGRGADAQCKIMFYFFDYRHHTLHSPQTPLENWTAETSLKRGGWEESLVLCYIVVSVFTGVLVKLNNFPNKEKMISFPQYLERL